MQCAWIRSKIPAYLNDQLTPAELIRFQEHVQKCDTCKKILASYQSGSAGQKKVERPRRTPLVESKKKRFRPRSADLRRESWQAKLEYAGLIMPDPSSADEKSLSKGKVEISDSEDTNDLKSHLHVEDSDQLKAALINADLESLDLESVDPDPLIEPVPTIEAQAALLAEIVQTEDLAEEIQAQVGPGNSIDRDRTAESDEAMLEEIVQTEDLAEEIQNRVGLENSIDLAKALNQQVLAVEDDITGAADFFGQDDPSGLDRNTADFSAIKASGFQEIEEYDPTSIYIYPEGQSEDQEDYPLQIGQTSKELETEVSSSEPRDWQQNPELYLEVPYIHPVTQESLTRRVPRTSVEGMLFLQEQERERLLLERIKAQELEQEERMPFATIDPFPEERDEAEILESEQEKNIVLGSGAIAQKRLLDYWDLDVENLEEVEIERVNQGIKILPFKENPRKQAVLYRFTTIVISLALFILIALQIYLKYK